jgi:hypothetical protein
LWYAATTAIVLFAFAWFVYEVIEHRLGAALDRQLRSDFEVVETQVDLDAEEGTQWNVRGPNGDEPSPTISAWFEVWSKNGQLLLRHVSSPTTSNNNIALPSPAGSILKFRTLQFGHGWFVRVMEGPGHVEGQSVLIRVLRDQMEMRRTLGEIVKVSTLGFPLAVSLAAIGGYLIATRSLRALRCNGAAGAPD